MDKFSSSQFSSFKNMSIIKFHNKFDVEGLTKCKSGLSLLIVLEGEMGKTVIFEKQL